MSEKVDTGICLEACVSHYEQYGNHDVYKEQIERCPSQRALLFALLKSYFSTGMQRNGRGYRCGLCGDDIRKSNWFYGLNETEDRVTKMTLAQLALWKKYAGAVVSAADSVLYRTETKIRTGF